MGPGFRFSVSKKWLQPLFRESCAQDGPRFLAEKSAHLAREVSFPRYMSPEMTDFYFIPAAAAAGTLRGCPAKRAFRQPAAEKEQGEAERADPPRCVPPFSRRAGNFTGNGKLLGEIGEKGMLSGWGIPFCALFDCEEVRPPTRPCGPPTRPGTPGPSGRGWAYEQTEKQNWVCRQSQFWRQI